jgi:hypothetical protein
MEMENIVTYILQRLQFSALCIAGLLLATGWTQTEAPLDSLGELAKQTRAERATKDHISARKVLNEENEPQAHRTRISSDFWATIPPSTLTVYVPKPDRPPGPGMEDLIGSGRLSVRIGNTDWNTSFRAPVQQHLTVFLNQSWFRGASLKLGGVEDTTISGQPALLTHFNFDFKGIRHTGVALFVSAPEQVLSVGCMYRSVDLEKAGPICEDVINSAEAKVPTEYRRFKKPYQ